MSAGRIKILWADDEVDLLKAQILFLKDKGYDVTAVSNGQDAIDKCNEGDVDVIFLDEHMPGLSGLETLSQIKQRQPNIPVVMITKNEEENIMEEAIGAQIADYLIKPVKPNQILLTLKKIIDHERLISEKTNTDYRQQFQQLYMEFTSNPDMEGWKEIYKKLVEWELKLSQAETKEMQEVMLMQKEEANAEFNKFIIKNYLEWLHSKDVPLLSHNLIKKKVLPNIDNTTPFIFLLIDNLRLDQWMILKPFIEKLFKQKEEGTFYSILPTTTQYSRNAIFSGLFPLEIQKQFPDAWKTDAEEGGKNMFEKELLLNQLKRNNLNIKADYFKISNQHEAKVFNDNILNILNNDFTAIVYNFVDMLSHARTEMDIIKQLASDESAYRSLTISWFEHSPLYESLKKLSEKKCKLFITSDHGTIRVKHPAKIVGDKETTSNLRYKQGKSLQYEPKDVFTVKDPHLAFLPKSNVSSSYVFAKEDKYFVYPNNYNYYVNFYKNTFQHGGISLEEMIVPYALFTSKE